jgi:hypothetical protein
MSNSATLPNQSVEQLNWLTGHWQGTYEGNPATETWATLHNNSLVGTFQCTNFQGIQYVELIRIFSENGQLKLTILHLKEDLSSILPTEISLEFKITEITESSFTALSPDPEFPNTMVYNLENNKITGYTLIDDHRRDFFLTPVNINP